jgi:tRNA U34 2-thiouridine synthase MnmA/TrmU
MARQGVEILGMTFETPFFSAGRARETAEQIGIPLEVADITQEHLQIMHAPRYGFGKNMNPCIDCRILMFKTAAAMMERESAAFLFTGEVVGQRPMSQGKQTLLMTAKKAGLAGRVLRPLSARLLPETEPELSGQVDRTALFDLQGRGRKRQTEMAAAFGITFWPPPAGGCLLTDPIFSRRLRDLFDHHPVGGIRDIELLKTGRHFRLYGGAKVIVGRNANENNIIDGMALQGDLLVRTVGFPGPTVLGPEGGGEEERVLVGRLCLRYSDAPPMAETFVVGIRNGKSETWISSAMTREDAEALLV